MLYLLVSGYYNEKGILMAIEYAAGKKTMSATARLTFSALIGAVILIIVGVTSSWLLAPLMGWVAAALFFVISIWTTIWPMNGTLTAQFAVREDPSRGLSDIVTLGASIASLVAVGLVLVSAGNSTGASRLIQVGLGIVSVVISWVVVHTLFTLRYAELYYLPVIGGVDFPETKTPQYSDFAYLAFTLGMTYQVSDTNLAAQKFRMVALRHALLSYLFGTVIVATTINLIAGLSK
jgi:uncharacterized membrane protein